jgi:hypothetical protein
MQKRYIDYLIWFKPKYLEINQADMQFQIDRQFCRYYGENLVTLSQREEHALDRTGLLYFDTGKIVQGRQMVLTLKLKGTFSRKSVWDYSFKW